MSDNDQSIEGTKKLTASICFRSGGWGDELGEDFFGFRSLGLDKEFGLKSMSVPSSLFHGRVKRPNLAAQQG